MLNVPRKFAKHKWIRRKHYIGSRVEQLPAVDDKGVAADKRGLVGNKKQHPVGDFFGSAHTQQCLVAARQPGALLLCRVFVDGPARRKSTEARRVDGAGADAVYPYTVL